MVQVKATKTELKAQRETQKRLLRYLPTLQLKQQLLQVEVRKAQARVDDNHAREQALLAALQPWVDLFSDPADFSPWLSVRRVEQDVANIAGVNIPVLREVVFGGAAVPLLDTPPWYDAALATLRELARLRLQRAIFAEQRRLLADELRVTNQRVNLFERVKIPECREAIRRIRIALGDAQTLDVARGKIAKQKAAERELSQ
jgi:V/A-type H+-transporting ATPase subunit D